MSTTAKWTETMQSHPLDAALEDAAGPSHLRHIDREGHQDFQAGHQLDSMATDSDHPGHPAGRRLALPDVEPHLEQAGSESEATWAVDEDPYGTPDSGCELRPPVNGGTIPWLRETELYDLLYKLAYRSTWQLLQMTLQPHNAKRCSNANTLQESLKDSTKNKRNKKGKGTWKP